MDSSSKNIRFISSLNNKCIQVDSSKSDVTMISKHNDPSQIFSLERITNLKDTFLIRNIGSRKLITFNKSWFQKAINVVQKQQYSPSESYFWNISLTSKNTYTIKNIKNDNVLTIQGGIDADNVALVLEEYKKHSSQQWSLQRIGDE